MRGETYFDPFTGEILGTQFSSALAAGSRVREEWMRRRKALRELKRRARS